MRACLQDTPLLIALIGLLPGLIAWWSGRALADLPDDPILPERLAVYHRRNGVALVLAMATIAATSGRSLWWAVPLMWVAMHMGAFPLRKALFGETWSLSGYLSFFGRLYIGLFGFWILLAAAPALAATTGKADWIAASLLGVTLILWNLRYADVVRWCLRARPLAEGPFLTRCRALADACGLPPPQFERIDLKGGVIANALALPSSRGSSVLFTDTLLQRLDDDEAAAICAHELAHLEHHSPNRLRRLNLLSIALIVLSVMWAPGFRLAGLKTGMTSVVWLVVLTAALVLRARGKQRQETACDARAVALAGEAPLIRALTRLYSIARLPRRVDLQQERSGTHPSLARRIRDIRRAAGTTSLSLHSDTSFTSTDGCTVVTFEQSSLQWIGSDAVTQRVEYVHVVEIRIAVRRRGAPRLVIRGQQARSWEMVLAAEDLGRAQAVLDVVDSRLGDVLPPPAIPLKVSRTLAAVVTIIALVLGQFAVAIVSLLASFRVATPLLVAAGLASLTGAATMLRGMPSPFDLLVALMLSALACTLFVVGWSNRKDVNANVHPLFAGLVVLAILGTVSLTLSGLDPVRIHQSAIATPSAIVWPMALAGALACSAGRRARIAAAAVVLLAAVTCAIASPAFLDVAAEDPFLVQAPAIRWVPVDAYVEQEFAVPPATARLRLSPNGRMVAALNQTGTADDVTSIFHVGPAGAALLPVPADDVIFVGDDHLLTASSDNRGTTLQKRPLGNPDRAVWEQRVEDVLAPSLSVDPSGRRWRLTGWTAEEGIARAEGRVGVPHVELTRWPADATRYAVVNAVTTSGTDALVVETRYDRGVFERLPFRWQVMVPLLQEYNQASRYWRVGPERRVDLGTSRLGADCNTGLLSEDTLVCTAFDGARTRIFSLAADGAVQGLGSIDGRFASDRNTSPGWLSGWAEGTPVAIRLSTGEAFRAPDRDCRVTHLTATGDRLAAVVFGDSGATVRMYSLSGTATADAARH